MKPIDKQSEIKRFISAFNAAVTNIRLYSAAHPQANRYVATAFTAVNDLLRLQREVTILLVDNELIVDKRPVKGDVSIINPFVKIIGESGIERLTFIYGVEENEFQALVHALAAPDSRTIKSSPHIKLGIVELRATADSSDDEALSPLQAELAASIIDLRNEKYQEMKSIYQLIKNHQKVDVSSVDDLIRALMKGFSEAINPMALLASVKSAGEYMFTHVVNVCILTMGQAESLGFKDDHLHQIGIASVLHDIGKLYMPDEIINKPGNLDANERKVIETHPTEGAKYIIGLDNMPKLAVLGALEHHIHFDGSGYPDIKGGWRPNIVSQMIAIADVFDALRSPRVYKAAMPKQKIIGILRKESGTTFNPDLVSNFLKLIKVE